MEGQVAASGPNADFPLVEFWTTAIGRKRLQSGEYNFGPSPMLVNTSKKRDPAP